MIQRTALAFGMISAAFAVAAGAFGAHGLKNSLEPDMLAVFETAVRYQMYHSFAMIVVGLVASRMDDDRRKEFRVPFWFFVCGTFFFSGSLYTICLSGVTWFGIITPVGGLSFILGWLTFVRLIWK